MLKLVGGRRKIQPRLSVGMGVGFKLCMNETRQEVDPKSSAFIYVEEPDRRDERKRYRLCHLLNIIGDRSMFLLTYRG
jgi:hypothetical protein